MDKQGAQEVLSSQGNLSSVFTLLHSCGCSRWGLTDFWDKSKAAFLLLQYKALGFFW
jgi:hypothetical protein